MAWTLTNGTFWRRSGTDILVVNSASLLRLNAASAVLFEVALGLPHEAEEISAQAFADLTGMLRREGMLEECDAQADPQSKRLEALPSRKCS